MPVHHVDVDPVGAGFGNRLDLAAKGGEIRRQDGGGDADRLLRHGGLRFPDVLVLPSPCAGKDWPGMNPAS